MICPNCTKGNPAECKGKTLHWTYCDNQHRQPTQEEGS